MQVTRNCQGWGRLKRPPLAAVLMLALAGVGGIASAVEFDEKIKAPMMKNAVELKTQAQSFATKYREIRAATPALLITDAALARQQVDLRWQLEQAINNGRPVGELAAIGLVSHADGSYSIDPSEHPEWRDLPETMKSTLSSDLVDGVSEALVQRGFRLEDVSTLKAYVAAHDAKAEASAATLPATLGFSRVVRKFDKAGRPVPDALVISHWYQNTRTMVESNRIWAEGLLKALDAQRRRVLLSYFTQEVKGSEFFIPESVSVAIGQTLAAVRLPDFEKRVTAESRGDAP